MKNIYNFLRPTSNSTSHALACQNNAQKLATDITNIGSSVAQSGTSGLKVAVSAGVGFLAFKGVTGLMMLSYSSLAITNNFVSSGITSFAQKALGESLLFAIKHPVVSLSGTMLSSTMLHPSDLKNFVVGAVSGVGYALKGGYDLLATGYEAYQTGYTKIWEQFEPSIKNLKSLDLHENEQKLKNEDSKNDIEMKAFDKNIYDEDEGASNDQLPPVQVKPEVTSVVETSSWFSRLSSAVSSVVSKVSDNVSNFVNPKPQDNNDKLDVDKLDVDKLDVDKLDVELVDDHVEEHQPVNGTLIDCGDCSKDHPLMGDDLDN